MKIGKIYIPKGYGIIIIIFAAIFILGIIRNMGVVSALSMACLFGSLSSLIAYIISAFKKNKSGVYLLSFIILLAGMLISNVFTSEYSQLKSIESSTEQTSEAVQQ